ncbi:hypothetical protein KP509_33G041200 [Ceratopteris richardii]|nr:hypothetical protein KP509_33G041200 [Ceratopteris richardii]
MTLTPFGCFSIVLAYFPSGSKDKNGCLTSLNNLSLEHRRRLLQLIYELRATHKDARFVFFDFYAAYEEIISNSKAFGFRDTLDACCGAGPAFAYRYNMQLFCGPSSSVASMTLCPDPNVFLKWDGIHNTHRFNLLLSDTIRTGRNIDPPNAFAGCALHS